MRARVWVTVLLYNRYMCILIINMHAIRLPISYISLFIEYDRASSTISHCAYIIEYRHIKRTPKVLPSVF